MALNKYKKMQLISDSDPEKLLERIRDFYEMFDIVSLYGVNGRHYAWLNFSMPVDMRVSRPKNKTINLDEMNKKLNK